MSEGPAMLDSDAYARLYEEQQPQLVAYARSLTGGSWPADDLVAEAHFLVWRRLSSGHSVDNVPAYLLTTVRNLAATVGRADRESPRDPAEAAAAERAAVWGDGDPGSRIAYVDLLSRVLGQLPERWVKALWLAEAEDQPLDVVGRRMGAGCGATAVLLHRAREGMRQAFLRAYPGTPGDPGCEGHWERMPAHVREADTAKQASDLRLHLEGCADCRARLVLLNSANDRLHAMVGPALLVFFLRGSGKFLAPLVGTGAGAGAGAGRGSGGHGGLWEPVRHVLTEGGKLPAVAVGAVGVTVAVAAVAVGLVFSGTDAQVPGPRALAAPTEARPEGPPVRLGESDAPAERQGPAERPVPERSGATDAGGVDAGGADSGPASAERGGRSAAPVAPRAEAEAPTAPAEPAVPSAVVPAEAVKPAVPTVPSPAVPAVPAEPVEPAAPAEPSAAVPAVPAVPVPPSAPAESTAPVAPTAAVPAEPVEPAALAEPAAPVPAIPAVPAQPSAPVESTARLASTAPVGPTAPAVSSDPVDPTPVEPTVPAEPAVPVEPSTDPGSACLVGGSLQVCGGQ